MCHPSECLDDLVHSDRDDILRKPVRCQIGRVVGYDTVCKAGPHSNMIEIGQAFLRSSGTVGQDLCRKKDQSIETIFC